MAAAVQDQEDPDDNQVQPAAGVRSENGSKNGSFTLPTTRPAARPWLERLASLLLAD